MCQLWQIKENIKYNPFDDISISFNPLYVKENSHNKFTSFHWLICNAEWKFFNSFWLLKQNTFSQSCANSVTKSKRTLLKNGWSTAVECLNSLRTWRSRGHFKSKKIITVILLHFKPALTARNYIWKEYFFASWKITCAQAVEYFYATFLFVVYLWRTKWNERYRKQRRILNEPQNSR